VIYIVTLSWCCGSMSCVLSDSYAVQNEPDYGCASCAVWRETLYVAQRTSIARLILNRIRLTHNTQDMLPQHQLNVTI